MGTVKNDIRQLSKEAGGKRRAASNAEEWFETTSKAVREKAVQRSARRWCAALVRHDFARQSHPSDRIRYV